MNTAKEIFDKWLARAYDKRYKGSADQILQRAIKDATKVMAKRARKFAKDKAEYDFVFCDELN